MMTASHNFHVIDTASGHFRRAAELARDLHNAMRPRWRREVERARVAFGVRCVTAHVSEGEWLASWRAGMDPASAVIEHLERMD